jgi:hypothetical protein
LEKGDRIGAATVAIAGTKDALLAQELIKALDEKSPTARLQSLVRLNSKITTRNNLKHYLILQAALAQPITDYDLIVRFGLYNVWLPDHAEYRQTGDFKKLVSALGLPAYWRRQGFPPQCKPLGQNDFECR